MPKLLAIVLSAAALATTVAACGSSSNSSGASATTAGASSTSSAASSATSSAGASSTTGGAGSSTSSAGGASASGSSTVNLGVMGTMLMFSTKDLTAKAGAVSIVFTNKSGIPHNVTVQQGTGGKVLGATPTFNSGTHTLKLTLKPGTYTYYCSVPGHRQAGMQGTLKVS
jgi:plastocyanin